VAATEKEPTMKRMLIDALHPEEMRVAIADNKQIFEFDFVSSSKQQVKGNIYLAKITRVEPSLQAAFVEYGGGKQGFLPFAEIHPDYYQIPVSDRKKLLEEVERELAEDAEEDEEFTPSAVSESAVDAEQGEVAEQAASAGDMADVLNQRADKEVGSDVSSDSSQYTQYERNESDSVRSESLHSEHYDASEPNPIAESVESSARERLAMQPEISVAIGAAHHQSDEVVPDHVVQTSEEIEVLQEHTEAAAEQEHVEVETIASEEEATAPRRKKSRVPFFKRYKIQEVIKRGQIVLVQVIKEERGNKGVSLTTYLSLAGRYSVLMPNSPRDGGVSRKISDIETRRRLKEVMAQLKLARGMSVIIRTAGIDRSNPEIRRDFDYLVKLWNRIREETLNSSAPALIYEENNLIKRAIRDQYTSDIEEVLVEGEAGYQEAHEFMKMLLPSHTGRVKQYKEDMPLFYAYGIEDQLLSMHDPVVKLRSGGYIVINPTEALISIDVNSGRSTGERNIEETASKSNIEAAHEIARQLRLRDLAGLIVIDFIDMLDSRNRRAVERNLKDALRSDRAKIQVGRISPFGLMEMSRQRLRPSIGESMHETCPSCAGRGVIRSHESLSLHLMRTLEKEAVNGGWAMLKLIVSEPLAIFLLNHKRRLLTNIETRHDVSIVVEIQHSYAISEFTIEKIRASKNKPDQRGNNKVSTSREPRVDASSMKDDMEALTDDFVEGEFSDVPKSDEQGGKRPRRSRGGRGRRGGRNRGDRPFDESQHTEAQMRDSSTLEDAVEAEADFAGSNENALGEGESNGRRPRSRGERGRRGGRGRGRRPWREDGDATASANPEVNEFDVAPKDMEADSQPRAVDADLPEFARKPAIEVVQSNVVNLRPEPAPQKVEEVSARPPGAPPRKGWWQQIIELD
jgi:ribonuclease E